MSHDSFMDYYFCSTFYVGLKKKKNCYVAPPIGGIGVTPDKTWFKMF